MRVRKSVPFSPPREVASKVPPSPITTQQQQGATTEHDVKSCDQWAINDRDNAKALYQKMQSDRWAILQDRSKIIEATQKEVDKQVDAAHKALEKHWEDTAGLVFWKKALDEHNKDTAGSQPTIGVGPNGALTMGLQT